MNYLAVPNVITKVLIRGRQEGQRRNCDYGGKGSGENEGERAGVQDALLLFADIGGATSQGMQAASGSQKRQGNGLSPWSLQHLDFSPVLTSDFHNRKNKLVLF